MMNDRLVLTPVINSDGCYKVYKDFGDIKAGFITDGGSIPSFLWRIFGHPFNSKYIEEYVEHDYDYATGRVPRKVADKKLRDGLGKKGMCLAGRTLVYLGVRLGGARHYNNNKKKEA